MLPELVRSGYDPKRFASFYTRVRLTLPPGLASDEACVSEEKFNLLMWAAAHCEPITLQVLIEAGKSTHSLLACRRMLVPAM